MSADQEEVSPVADCAACPVAFLRDVMREAHPEATLHLVAAARDLVLAFETMLRARATLDLADVLTEELSRDDGASQRLLMEVEQPLSEVFDTPFRWA